MTIPPFSESIVRVRYAETDAMGIVHHASYIVWLEIGRTELLRERGLSYREIEERGFLVVLSDLEVRYLAPARYDDVLIIRTELSEVRSRQMVFSYSINSVETGAPLVLARTSHIIVDQASRRPVRLPEELRRLFAGKPAPAQ